MRSALQDEYLSRIKESLSTDKVDIYKPRKGLCSRLV